MKKNLIASGIGNAILDVINEVEYDDPIFKNQKPGSMQLISETEHQELCDKKKLGYYIAGGSVANSIANLALIGEKCGFFGKVGNDNYGQAYINEFLNININCDIVKSIDHTGCCHVFITKDGQRTMATYLGASSELDFFQHDAHILKNSSFFIIEGYLLANEKSSESLFKFVKIAKECDCKIILSLSDSFIVKSHLKEINYLCKNGVDFVFGNEDEFNLLSEKEELKDKISDFASAHGEDLVLLCTMGINGVYLFENGGITHIDAYKDNSPKDTTGAGDAFLSGFVYGLVNGHDHKKSCFYGNYFSSLVIKHIGARLEKDDINLIQKFTV